MTCLRKQGTSPEESIKKVQEKANELLELDDEGVDLVRSGWGEYSLQGEEPVFEGIFAAVRLIQDLDLSLASPQMLEALTEKLAGTYKTLRKLLDTEVGDLFQHPNNARNADPEAVRKSRFDPVLKIEHNIKSALLPILTLNQHADRKRHSTAAVQELADIQLAKREAEEKLEAVNTILDAAQDASGKLGAGQHAKEFENLATEYKHWAFGWLAVSTLFAAAWLYTAHEFYLDTGDDLAWPKTVMRATLLAAGFALVTWTARNYRAHRHNFVVNRHRATALDTFQTFSGSASDADTKNAVLLQTTYSIFVAHPTGYSNEQAAPTTPASTVLEVIRNGAQRD